MKIIKYILIIINKNHDISDAIIGLIKKPDHTHILQLIGSEKIHNKFLKIRKTLNVNEVIASEMGINIRNILVLSRLNARNDGNKIQVKITVPITRNDWNIYKIIRIPFKGESGVMRIKSHYDFIIYGLNQTYALMTNIDFKKCRRYPKRLLCQFNTTRSNTCENDVFMNGKLNRCTLQNDYMPRVQMINSTHFYASIDQNTTLLWSCNDPEKSYYLRESAWIILRSECSLRTQNANPEHKWKEIDVSTDRHVTNSSSETKLDIMRMAKDHVSPITHVDHTTNPTHQYTIKSTIQIVVHSSKTLFCIFMICVATCLTLNYFCRT